MISSIFSFIMTTIILNPMVLFGVLLGVYGWYEIGLQVLIIHAQNPITYGILFGIALFYALLFKHIYHPNSKKIDWGRTALGSFGCFMKIIIAFGCTIAIIFAVNYGFGQKLDNYLRHESSVQQR